METNTFSSKLQDLPGMLLWIRTHLSKKGFDPKAIQRLEVASEEALVNIIHHSYANQEGKIEICIAVEPERVEIAIRDWGPPYDPLANAPEVDLEASIDAREVGGLGIFLIRLIMDEVVYQRQKDANILTMVKHFSRKK